MGKSLPTTMDSKDLRKSRKKSKQAAVAVEVSEDTTITPKDSTTSSDSPAKPTVDGIDTETMFENKKALKRAIRAARVRRPAEGDASSQAEPTKSSKKRKDRNEDADGAGPSQSTPEPPKKKHKNRTEFADPRIDTTLSPQSSKALEYAFTQMDRPSKWKFNKARQNWLIRNIWTPEALPDIYVSLVVKYLSNVQGGSKEKLIESCQSYLKPEEKLDPETKDAPSSTTTEPSTTSAVVPLKSILKPTPGPLIAGPLIDVPINAPEGSDAPASGVAVSAASSLSAVTLAEIRRTRAQTLLDALNGGKER